MIECFRVTEWESEMAFVVLSLLIMSLDDFHIRSTRRDLDEILSFHNIEARSLRGKTIFDLGCCGSNLAADLRAKKIAAHVIGFDFNFDA